MAPDQGWIPFIKILFGFVILIVLAVLAALIALGNVKAESSFGLNIILGGLLTLSGGFASWAFRGSAGKSGKTGGTDEDDESSAEKES